MLQILFRICLSILGTFGIMGIISQVPWKIYFEIEIDTQCAGECSKGQHLWEGRNEGCRKRQRRSWAAVQRQQRPKLIIWGSGISPDELFQIRARLLSSSAFYCYSR